jgi:excisionase family DNA binding protein
MMVGERTLRKLDESEGELAESGHETLSGSAHERARRIKPAVIQGEIMTRAEVAELLRCSEPHVVVLVEREGLPGFRLGKLWRFRRAEVAAWCERKTNGSSSA